MHPTAPRALRRALSCFAALALVAGLLRAQPIKIAVIGEQTTHSLHRENDPEYPQFLGEALDADFGIDVTKPHPTGGGHLYGAGSRFAVGNFGHPRGTVIDHALENPRAILRSDELKLAEQFAPQVVVLGPFGDHEPLAKVSLDQFAPDLRRLVDRILAFGSKPRLLLALPLPRGPKDDDENYRQIRNETAQVAREKNLPTIDLWTEFLGKAEFYKDATHLTVPGRKHLAAVVARAITSHGGVSAASPSTAVLMAPPAAGLPPYPAVVREETPAQREARMKWFREARFGLFIHWGVYAVPAGSWNGKPVSAEWIMNRAKITRAEYRPLAQQFTAAKYDPKAWAALAREAGMKYVVLTAKHHDGFALYDSAYSDWNAVKASPAKRDLIQPLADAVRAEGLKFGLYYSQSQDWTNPGGGTGNTPPWDEEQKQERELFDEYLAKIALPQSREIMEKYRPSYLFWDTEYSMTPERARPFFELTKEFPEVIYNNRLGGGVLGDTQTPEQRIPGGTSIRAFEVCMTTNGSWGYRADDQRWKTAQQLIRNLSDIVGKGGNYLLNVGPTAEGEFPPQAIEQLRAIGRWMRTNGEAIYATEAGPFSPLPAWGRATQKAKPDGSTTLYVHVWEWPADGKLLLPGGTQAARSGRLLASGAKVDSAVTPEGLVLTLPGAAPDPDVSVVALEFAGPVPIAAPAAQPAELKEAGTPLDPSGGTTAPRKT